MLELFYTLFASDSSGALASLILLAAGLWFFRRRVAWVRWLGACVSLAAIGLLFGSGLHLYRVSLLDEALPPPGAMVDIGGYKVHILAEGSGDGFAVVWLPGGHAGGLAMHHLHRLVRDDMRSILVDRPGSGWSDTGPFPRTTRGEVDEVIKALELAGEAGPFIFAGHSFGGLLAANIAYRYPEKTAALVLLDPTPLDVIFYGADSKGLSDFVKGARWRGLAKVFGLNSAPIPKVNAIKDDIRYVDELEPYPALMALANRGGQAFSTASAFEELTAKGLSDRAFDIAVYDGMLKDTPLYLVAPLDDPTTQPYAESVLGAGPDADRFAELLRAARERYLSASTRSQRVITPEGTGHNYPDTHPEFVRDTIQRIQSELASLSDRGNAANARWIGPYGGVPPFDTVSAADIDAAISEAVEQYRAIITRLSAQTDAPTFTNTVLPLEQAEEPLRQLQSMLTAFVSTARTPDIMDVSKRQVAAMTSARDETAQNAALLARLDRVAATALNEEQARLTSLMIERFERQGARLSASQQKRLSEIHRELSELQQTFASNTAREEQQLVVYVDNVSLLSGLPDAFVARAKQAALDRDHEDKWAIPIQRPMVWPVLQRAEDRSLRERVWRSWISRGANGDEFDNADVMSRILALRGEKATLFGFDNFAQWQTSTRMIGTPENAKNLLETTWKAVLAKTEEQIAELQEIAEGDLAGDTLKPWDFLYYQEIRRARDFAINLSEVQEFLLLDNVIASMFWSAKQLYGLDFRELSNIPVVHESIKVFEVSRSEQVIGLIYLDLFSREGKGPSSWSSQYRSYARMGEQSDHTQLPLVALHSAVTPLNEVGEITVPWERANVIFHEFGHTLQTLQNRAPYPSMGPLTLPWDFIEAPSLLHERWFMDETLLSRFIVDSLGEPMPSDMIQRLNASLRAERPISLTLNFLGSALVDMHLHAMADGRSIDVAAEEAKLLEEMGLPDAVDLTMYASHAFHTFSEQYAAGLYTYLWSNVIAADAADAFRAAPGGLWDQGVAAEWRRFIEAANRKPIVDAWRDFRGRDPEVGRLLAMYDLSADSP